MDTGRGRAAAPVRAAEHGTVQVHVVAAQIGRPQDGVRTRAQRLGLAFSQTADIREGASGGAVLLSRVSPPAATTLEVP